MANREKMIPKISSAIACKNFHFTVNRVEKSKFVRKQVFDHFDKISDRLIVEKMETSDETDSFMVLFNIKGELRVRN